VPTAFSELTTLRLGGPAARIRTVHTEAELADVLNSEQEPVLLVGGGSNLVVGDAGWPGLTVRIDLPGLDVRGDEVRVAAGQSWDELVQHTLSQGLVGLETMSGIPGLVGATPVQNVGAYGSDISDVLTDLRVYDRLERQVQTWPAQRCGFGFRTSVFKHTDRWVVLEVTCRLQRSELSKPVRYLELANRLGIEAGQRTAPELVRAEVLALRRSKGMLLDPTDYDTWSVGSFFVNPLLDEVPSVAQNCPSWEADGRRKLSAAWLIEQAGFYRGYCIGRGSVSVSNKHTLALTNRGQGTTAELMELAAHIRDGVYEKFQITLGPEAHLKGCSF
jgi:UDP-N-acetylmuramate dehydrogenase